MTEKEIAALVNENLTLKLKAEILELALVKCAAQAKFTEVSPASTWVEEVLLDQQNG